MNVAGGSSGPVNESGGLPQYDLPPPVWDPPTDEGATTAVAEAWGLVCTAMVAGLNDGEVGLNPGQVAEAFQDLDAYSRSGGSHRSVDELNEQLLALGEGLEDLSLQAGTLREALHLASLQAGVGRDFMHLAMEFNAGPGGHPGRQARLQFESDVLDFVIRVAGGGVRRPETEVRGNLALLTRVIDEIIWCGREWKTLCRICWSRRPSRAGAAACAKPAPTGLAAGNLRGLLGGPSGGGGPTLVHGVAASSPRAKHQRRRTPRSPG